MKGDKLIIKVLIYLSLASAFIMVLLNLYPSWSQYARSLEEPLLFIALGSIMLSFGKRASSFEHGERHLYTLIWPVNVKQINNYTAFMFFGVLCTPVTHPYWWIQTLHFVFTALAIGTAYGELLSYYESNVGKGLAVIGSLVGVLGFLLGFLFKFYTVGVGELIAAIPIAIHVLNTNNK